MRRETVSAPFVCALHGRRRRTYGLKEYVKRTPKSCPRHPWALVHDTGTGGSHRYRLHDLPSAPILEKELACLKKLGVEINSRGVNGSDHQSFDAVGVPGFAFQQNPAEYRLTHHSQSDTFDKARPEDLKQGAQVMAIAAMRVANLPALLPRDEE